MTDRATGAVLDSVPELGRTETERAIEAAALALPAWRAKTAKERAVVLKRWYELIMAAPHGWEREMFALDAVNFETTSGTDLVDAYLRGTPPDPMA